MNTERNLTPFTTLLIFEVGAVGCAPLNFEKELATDLGAKYISSNVLVEFSDSFVHIGDRKVPRDLHRNIGNEIIRSIVKTLNRPKDVVYEKFINTQNERKNLQEFKRIGDIALVALDFCETPEGIIAERLRSTNADENGVIFGFPASDVFKHFENMLEKLNKPRAHEEIDIIIELDGSQGCERLVDQVYKRLDAESLIPE